MKDSSDNNWISFSDIMTVLMVIFLFISISYMLQVQKRQAQRDEIFKEYKNVKNELYIEINKEFKKDFIKWKVELNQDLSIKFTNPNILFEADKSALRPKFKSILNSFIPRYFNIIFQDKYINKIAEIRIEGHSDPSARTPKGYKNKNYGYIENLTLSQERSTSVLAYMLQTKYFLELTKEQKELLLFKITANGLSSGKVLDKNKEFCYISKKDVNFNYSRRVEFRIITTSEKLIEKVLKELEN